jgi:hypothetical protein
LFNLPTIVTLSNPDGRNGPMLDVVTEILPEATIVSRLGEIDPFDNQEFM